MMNPNRCNNGEALLQKLRQIDFALYDTVLYLDAYPNCRKALAYYHSLLDMQRKLTSDYQAHYGPITVLGNESKNSWDWTATPWPWEMT